MRTFQKIFTKKSALVGILMILLNLILLFNTSLMKINMDNSVYDLESYKEILELIPIIQKKVKLGMDRKLKKPMQIEDILKMDRDLMTGPQSLLQGK